MEAYIENLLSDKKTSLEQTRIRDLVINSDSEDEPEIKQPEVKQPEPITKSPSNMSMEDYIASMMTHDDVINSDSEDEPEVKQPEPITKSPSNMSMEDYIASMMTHDDVINSDSEDEPEAKQPEAKQPEAKQPEPITKPPSNMSMEDYIASMMTSDEVINSDSEDEPDVNPSITNQVQEYDEKIEARKHLVEDAKKRFERKIPKIVFIVPYRDKYLEKEFFVAQMLKVLEGKPDNYYKIYYIQQNNATKFNRGAMKNIGFSILKNQYPTYYKNITLVFNDIDVMPYDNHTMNYETTQGTIKHFYGFKYALGGIFSVTAGDFEKTNGFPNMWEWGYEDIIFKNRADKKGLSVDYSQFYPFNHGNVLKLKQNTNGLQTRNPKEYNIPRTDGLNTLSDVTYVINEETGVVDIQHFNVNETSIAKPTTNVVATPVRRYGRMF